MSPEEAGQESEVDRSLPPPEASRIIGRHEQSAAEMTIAAEKDWAGHSSGKHELHEAEQPCSRFCEGVSHLNLRSRQTSALALGQKISF